MHPTDGAGLERWIADALHLARTEEIAAPPTEVAVERLSRTVLARRPGRRALRLASAVLTAVSLLVLTGLGAGRYYLSTSLHAVQQSVVQLPVGVTTPPGHGSLTAKPKAGQPFTVLVLGTDSRDGTGTEYGPGSQACQCSDTIILARVDPQTAKVSLLSVPRDTKVWVTGRNETTKINAAYGRGADNSVATIEEALQIPINHYVVLDLAGFKSLVDAIGGIKLDFPYEVQDKNAGLYVFKTGCQKVDGNTALAISRSRELKYLASDGKWTYDPGGEYGRARRQQILMRVIAAHTVKQSLGNPATALSVIRTFTSHHRLQVDPQASASELLNLAGDFSGFDAGAMQTFSLPTFTHRENGIDYEILRPTADVATIQAWYDAVLPTPKVAGTRAAATTSPPVAPTATVRSPAPAAEAAGTTSPAPTPTPAATAVPNTPHPYDPVPCP